MKSQVGSVQLPDFKLLYKVTEIKQSATDKNQHLDVKRVEDPEIHQCLRAYVVNL